MDIFFGIFGVFSNFFSLLVYLDPLGLQLIHRITQFFIP